LKSEESSVQSSPMESFLVIYNFLCVSVVQNFFFMCTSVTAAFSLHTLKALVHNNNNNPFTLLLHSRVYLTVLIHLPALSDVNTVKSTGLFWDGNCTPEI